MTATANRPFGTSVKRREDPRLITGRGTYVDDVQSTGLVYMALLRSPHAHARIRSINTEAAKNAPGVVGVYTGADTASPGASVPCGWVLPDMKMPAHPPLAIDTVRMVGDPVAAVLGETREAARDAVGLIEVDYEPLPVVTNEIEALTDGAPLVHDDLASNLCFTWKIGSGDVDAALAQSEVRVTERIVNQRLIPNAIEPRAVVAQYARGTDEYLLYTSTQIPHLVRLLLSLTLGIPETRLRVIAPDVGGAFGSKLYLYGEEMVACVLTKLSGRTVKWIEERSEAYQATTHGRAQTHDLEIGAMKDGTFTALRVRNTANLGAYLSTFAPGIPTVLFGVMLSGAYRIPNIDCEVRGVFTNTTPVDAYRGAGRPEAIHLVERAVDLVADAIGMDAAEIRKKNFIPADAFPYTTATGVTYDSGNYPVACEQALQTIDYAGLREEQTRRRASGGKLMGIGMSSYVEICGMAPSQVLGAVGGQAGGWESATVRVHPTGKVSVMTGASSHGQGHETTFSQIAADELGIPLEDIEIIHGDTDKVQFGIGTFGSRSTAVGGTALHMSLTKIKDKARKIAAHQLEADETDLDYEEGAFRVKGAPERAKTFAEIALAAFLAHNYPAGLEPGLDATSFFDPSNFTWPFGTHICVTEIDPDTGNVEIVRYLCVDDCGRVVNPMIAEGQVHGGVAQGIAQALYEEGVYDESGQLISGSMMDYAVPTATQLPRFETSHTVTPSPVNPMGVKGIGEAGTIAASAAVVNSVVDALSHLGVRHLDMPLRPERVWRAIHQA
ncbi:MAG TPA: molybdopterin cofactor-binding domain-containing protein [Chloroflexota bacterium]|nr:molybdopterin cofactor-binding domain-containing protein [Chloroflexota bacterium]